jgi:hypothetical protein
MIYMYWFESWTGYVRKKPVKTTNSKLFVLLFHSLQHQQHGHWPDWWMNEQNIKKNLGILKVMTVFQLLKIHQISLMWKKKKKKISSYKKNELFWKTFQDDDDDSDKEGKNSGTLDMLQVYKLLINILISINIYFVLF